MPFTFRIHIDQGRKDLEYLQRYDCRPEGNGTKVERTIGGKGSGGVAYIFYPAFHQYEGGSQCQP